MAGRRIRSPKVRESDIAPISLAMEAGGFVFLSGIIPRRPEDGHIIVDDIRAATRQSMENIKHLLEAAGATMNDLVKTNVFLANIDDFGVMNEVYRSYFTGDPPTRTTVQVARLGLGNIVEIEGLAYVAPRAGH